MLFHSLFILTAHATQPTQEVEVVKLRDIINNFNRLEFLFDLPFPPVLVRSVFAEFWRTIDYEKKTYAKPLDGEFKVQATLTATTSTYQFLLHPTERIGIQEMASLACAEFEVLANRINYESSFYANHITNKSDFYPLLLKACAERDTNGNVSDEGIDKLFKTLGGTPPHKAYTRMIWDQLLSINDRIVRGEDGGILDNEILDLERMSLDDNYDLLVRLLDPPLVLAKGSLLGKGTYGTVQRAHWENMGNKAVKTISISISNFDHLINEIQALRKVSEDSRFVKLYRVEMEAYNQLLLTMELLEGKDGKWIAENKRINGNMRILAAIIKEVLLGLQSLHEHGYLHNDIKWDNIFITKKGKVKILDLGLATRIGRSYTPGQFKAGVAGLAGPELYDPFHDYTPASDVWTVGTMAIHLSTNSWMSTLPARGTPLTDDLREQMEYYVGAELLAFSEDAKTFLHSMLKIHAEDRLTIEKLLEQPFLKNVATEAEVATLVKDD